MAIQMRRGDKKDFQPEKLKVGEFAVPTDTGEVYIKTSENTTKGIATLKANGKLEQMPTYTDVGAAPTSHNHSASNITSGTLPVARGGTGKSTLESGHILLGNGTGSVDSIEILPISKGGTGSGTVGEALTNLGAVPKTTTINTKSLNSDITLNANDVCAIALNAHIGIPMNADLNNSFQVSYSRSSQHLKV